jgi:hypothetical protein
MCIVLVIICMYYIQPVYFEQYVLMKIPEYFQLNDALSKSKETIDITKSELKKYKDELAKITALGGTEAEIIAHRQENIELEVRIKCLKNKLINLTGTVGQLKQQLNDSHGDIIEMKKIQDDATKRMKEMNDLLISEFELPDKELARRIQAARDTILNLLSTSKDVICEFKEIALLQVAGAARHMRRNAMNTNKVCDRSQPLFHDVLKGMRIGPRGIGPRKHGQYGTMYPSESSMKARRQVYTLIDDVESTLSYVLQNKFCDKDLKFSVDAFEKYIQDLINGLCESDDWKKITGLQLDYILNKPASYLGKNLVR